MALSTKAVAGTIQLGWSWKFRPLPSPEPTLKDWLQWPKITGRISGLPEHNLGNSDSGNKRFLHTDTDTDMQWSLGKPYTLYYGCQNTLRQSQSILFSMTLLFPWWSGNLMLKPLFLPMRNDDNLLSSIKQLSSGSTVHTSAKFQEPKLSAQKPRQKLLSLIIPNGVTRIWFWKPPITKDTSEFNLWKILNFDIDLDPKCYYTNLTGYSPL